MPEYAVNLSAHETAAVDDLINFARPPVTELVLGVQFSESIVDLDVVAAFGLRTKAELPRREHHGPLARTTESFAPAPSARRIAFEVMRGFELPRTWFISDDEREVVQMQADRLIFNWRRMTPDDDYPRYARLRPIFERHLATLRHCLADAGRSSGIVDLAEVTYVDELAVPDAPAGMHPPLSRSLELVRDVAAGGPLPAAEDMRVQARFRIPDPNGGDRPAGRLYVDAEPSLRAADRTPIYLLKLTANIVMPMPDDAALVGALDLGREWAVRGFEQITTKEVKALWQPLPTENA